MPAFLLALIIGPAVCGGQTNASINMTTRDAYLDQLAREVRNQLQCPTTLDHHDHHLMVKLLRDDDENQGLWLHTRSYGYHTPKHVFICGVWPSYRGRDQYPGESITVKVTYGREVRSAARDLIRRFLPWYTQKWQQMLEAAIRLRDRDRHRTLLIEELRAMPGVSVHEYQNSEHVEICFDREKHHYLDLQLWGTGDVGIARGSLSDDLILKIVRNLVEEPAALYGEAARRKRYEENEKRQVLGTLKDIADVLERNKAADGLGENRRRIALELRLRGVQMDGDHLICHLGRTWCRFKWHSVNDLLRTAKEIYRKSS